MKNRIKELRQKKGLSAEALGKLVGTSRSMIESLQKGERRLNEDWLTKIAKALNVRPQDLIVDEHQMVPVIGTVGAGAQVFPIDDYALIQSSNIVADGKGGTFRHLNQSGQIDDSLDYVEAPPGVGSGTVVALRVKGDSMMPALMDGWVIYYNQRFEGDFDQFIGQMCVIGLKDGRACVKRLKRGRTFGKYDLISHNASDIEDVELAWCAKVSFIKPA